MPQVGRLRLLLGLAVAAFLTTTAVRNFRAPGALDNCETFCPFGGAEGLFHLLKEGQYLCALCEVNVALFLGLLILSLLAGRLFCSHLCPLGMLFERLGSLARRLGRAPRLPAARLDGALQWLRVAVLVVVLVATQRAGDLVFRGYDPFFALFSGHAHGIAWTSYLVLALALLAALAFPMAFCRWFCPLGACQDLLGRWRFLRVHRDPAPCTGCRRCDRACPQAIAVASVVTVRDSNCTLCQACVAACPASRALAVSATRGIRPQPWMLPALAGLYLLGATLLAPALRVPTLAVTFSSESTPQSSEATFVVAGLTCRGRSLMLAENLRYLPGTRSLTTFGRERKAVIRYDPARLEEADIRACIEGSMVDPETGVESAPFQVQGRLP